MNKDDICFHSVLLDEDACKGCTICVTGCPVEAIRVRRGKARILEDRCIDCGECIRRCPNRAKKANSAPLASLDGYDWKIALPAPSFYGQFPRQYSIRQILGALLAVGFDDIIEVAEGAKIITQATKEYLKENGVRPLISSSCPAIVRLIQVRFPTLLDSIIPLNSPMEIAADIARRRSDPQKQKGLEVGIFFISPCPAKITAVKYPLGQKTSQIDQVLSIKDIYLPVLQQLKKGCKEYEGTLAPSESTGWSCREGEAKALGIESWISVDGITETTSLLESIEDGTLEHIQFVEAMACPSGCAGGPLTVQHPAQTKELIRYHQEELLQEFPKKKDFSRVTCSFNTKNTPKTYSPIR